MSDTRENFASKFEGLTDATPYQETSVLAEDAPIGVQLWPTTRPSASPDFTLMRVETVRTATRSFVRWIYESGKERTFDMGESVVVRYPA